MTQVDFYVSTDASPLARELLACRIASKAYARGLSIYVHTASPEQASLLDEKLWTFQEGSFLPHEPYSSTANQAPIVIGHEHNPDITRDVMINLAHEVPLFFSRFLRVAELVDDNEKHRLQARERFRFYRERGYPLQSHEISAP